MSYFRQVLSDFWLILYVGFITLVQTFSNFVGYMSLDSNICDAYGSQFDSNMYNQLCELDIHC